MNRKKEEGKLSPDPESLFLDREGKGGRGKKDGSVSDSDPADKMSGRRGRQEREKRLVQKGA